MNKPKVITLCGSTRFIEEFDKHMLRLTLEGVIVLTIGTHRNTDGNLARKYADGFQGKKEMLDELHKRKIDLSDGIFVINKDGYIGLSTRGEIEYAREMGRQIEYLEPI